MPCKIHKTEHQNCSQEPCLHTQHITYLTLHVSESTSHVSAFCYQYLYYHSQLPVSNLHGNCHQNSYTHLSPNHQTTERKCPKNTQTAKSSTTVHLSKILHCIYCIHTLYACCKHKNQSKFIIILRIRSLAIAEGPHDVLC